jgi:signal transduction histidine kinase
MNDEPPKYERQMNPNWAVDATPRQSLTSPNYAIDIDSKYIEESRGNQHPAPVPKAHDRVFSDLTERVRRFVSDLQPSNKGAKT